MWEFIWRWETLWYLLLLLYVPSCIGLIVIVLLQKGKGVGFAGAFGMGGGGSDTVFGPRMSKSLPQRLTYVMAAIFMLFALIMSLISGRLGKGVGPEKVAETPNAVTETDLSGLPGLGSELKEGEGEAATTKGTEGGATAPATETPAGTPAPAETAPAAPPAPEPPPPASAPAAAPATPPAPAPDAAPTAPPTPAPPVADTATNPAPGVK